MNKLLEIFKDHASRLNLVSKGDQERLEDKHFPDCLEVMKLWEPSEGSKIADLGTGGGLPGLVLAEQFAKCEFTLIDATQKKIAAINSMVKELNLDNVKTISGRFEELAHEKTHREEFDYVMARAVAALPTLLEYAVGFLKIDGLLFAWKGSNYLEEINDAREAMELLSFDLEKEHKYSLPSGEERVLLVFRKNEATGENYPRPNGKPKKSPL